MTSRPTRRPAALAAPTALALGLVLLGPAVPVAPAAAAAGPAGVRPATVGPAPAPPAAAGTTTVTVRITGCEGCSLQAMRAIAPGTPVRPTQPTFWTGPKVTVVRGRAVLRIATAATAGTSLNVLAPWNHTNAVGNLVMRYAGTSAGQVVGPAVAARATRASGCWAGTSARAVTWTVRVVKVPATTLDGRPTFAPRAWASPALASVGPFADTWRGTLANQDAWYC